MLTDRGYQKIEVARDSSRTKDKDEVIFEARGEHKVRKIDNYPEKILVEYIQECTMGKVKNIESNSIYSHCRYVLITDKSPNQGMIQNFKTMRTNPEK